MQCKKEEETVGRGMQCKREAGDSRKRKMECWNARREYTYVQIEAEESKDREEVYSRWIQHIELGSSVHLDTVHPERINRVCTILQTGYALCSHICRGGLGCASSCGAAALWPCRAGQARVSFYLIPSIDTSDQFLFLLIFARDPTRFII
jgi:hypothetical protein